MSKIKKRNLKLTCWLLSLVMVFCSLPFTSFAVTSEAEQPTITEGTEVLSGITEIVERREENVKHFRLPDGTAQAIIYSDAVHRKDSDGAWQDINNNLTTSTKISGAYATEDMRAVFAQSFSANGNLFSLNEDGYSISMKLLADSLSTSTMAISPSLAPSTVSVTNAPLRSTENRWDTVEQAKEVNNKSSIVYTNVRAGTDLEYVLVGNSVKENIIINQKSDSYTYRFELALTGLNAVLNEDGSVSLTDKTTDEIKYLIPAPFMYDADGVYSDDVYYTLTQSANGCILAVIADSSWINADGRAFPVTVDPTIQTVQLVDTYIDTDTPDENYNSSASLLVGSNQITLISATLPSLPTGSVIEQATMYVKWYYPSSVSSGTTVIGAYQILQGWTATSVNWNTMSSYANMGISTSALGTKTLRGDINSTVNSPYWTNFDITTLYSNWYNGTANNNGIAIKYSSGTLDPVYLVNQSAYYELIYSEPYINGIYKIKNVATNMYLSVDGAKISEGTKVLLNSGTTSDGNKAQIFKICYVDSTSVSENSYNMYKIRPMTNNELGLTGSSTSGVTVEAIGTTNTNDFSSYSENSCISIIKQDTDYALKIGDGYTDLYISAPTGATAGTQATVSSSVSNNSLWMLESCSFTSSGFTWEHSINELPVETSFDFDVAMYNPSLSINGPVVYDVLDTDGTSTQLATINSSTGKFTALAQGTVKVRAKYLVSGSSYNTSTVTVTIGNRNPSFIENNVSGLYIQSGTSSTVSQEDYYGDTSQRWAILLDSSGYYKIQNVNNNLYLTAPSSTASGQSISLATYSSSTSARQLWSLTKLSSGNYRIQSKNLAGTNIVLAVSSSTEGAGLVQLDYTTLTTDYSVWNIHQMLPISGSEVEYDPDSWNNNANVLTKTNCYMYALNTQVAVVSNTNWPLQPGEPSECFTYGQGDITADLIKQCVEKDADVLGFCFKQVEKYEVCPAGTYKVALVVETGYDYHWYRQDPDGMWSHKPGRTPVINVDNNNDFIYSPDLAESNYSIFVGYFMIIPLNNMYYSTLSLEINENTTTSSFEEPFIMSFFDLNSTVQIYYSIALTRNSWFDFEKILVNHL